MSGVRVDQPESQTSPKTPHPQQARIDEVLDKIERVRQVRRHKFYLRDERITLSHGSGGKATHNLIEGVFAPSFANPMLDRMDDAATFSIADFGLPILDYHDPPS